MKGTARRGRTTREDREIAEWLRNDPKNRSENVMIVDLLRNDLGRVARTGTVHADRLFDVERYATLWQMTSTVSAELRPEVGFHEIFRALFPSGSVTGAPKVRAMQLLAELEEAPRGVYTGAIGFFSPQQTVFNVAIRTLELEGGPGLCGSMGAGSGIVIDSDPAEEYRECLLKASFLTGPAHRTTEPLIASQPDKLFLIETMLWDGAYPFIELHLDRLTDSADYFGFACDRAAVKAALEEHARQFYGCIAAQSAAAAHRSRRQRADRERTPAAKSGPASVARVCISLAPHRSRRPHALPQDHAAPHLRARISRSAAPRFRRRAVSESARRSNRRRHQQCVYRERRQWSTPPVECGLLAGVFRRHLLETRPEIEERVLYLNDLRQADCVYIANAVRGLRRVDHRLVIHHASRSIDFSRSGRMCPSSGKTLRGVESMRNRRLLKSKKIDFFKAIACTRFSPPEPSSRRRRPPIRRGCATNGHHGPAENSSQPFAHLVAILSSNPRCASCRRGNAGMAGASSNIAQEPSAARRSSARSTRCARHFPRLPLPAHLAPHGFWLKRIAWHGHPLVHRRRLQSARCALRRVRSVAPHRNQARISLHLNVIDAPAMPIRWVDEWDNANGTVERGYGGPVDIFRGRQSARRPERRGRIRAPACFGRHQRLQREQREWGRAVPHARNASRPQAHRRRHAPMGRAAGHQRRHRQPAKDRRPQNFRSARSRGARRGGPQRSTRFMRRFPTLRASR